MNPNVTYNSYAPPNASHSHYQQHPSYIHQTPHTSNPPSGVYRINPSNRSTPLGTMDNASLTNYNTNTNAGAGTPGGAGTIGTGVATSNGGGPRRQDTRNSYLSYASTNTPSWVNPSTMLETQAQSTPVMKGSGSRPLPDPSNYQGRGGGSAQGYQGYNGHGGYAQPAYSGGYGNHYGGHGTRPPSGGYVITNVTEEEEEEYDDENEEGDERHHHHEDGGDTERANYAPQYQASYGYHGTTPGGVNTGQNVYSMPVGMGGPDRMGVPMERVAPPTTIQQNGATTRRRPLPIPGASQPLGGGGSAFSPKRKKSFIGGFWVGLRRLPKRVLRYGSKKKPRLGDEIDGDEEFGLGGFGGVGEERGESEHGLPQYNSKPVSPTAGPSNAKRSQTLEENTSGMPGGIPLSPPVNQQSPPVTTTMNETKAKRKRNPSISLTPPSGETLGLHHMTNPEDQEYFNTPPRPEGGEGDASVGGIEFPSPSLERNRTTTMMYHEEPAAPATQETHGTMATGEVTPSSERPPTVRQTPSASASRMASNATSGNITNERVRAATPAPVINTAVPPPANALSPETAHPPPANDYMKMTTSPRTQTQATEVTEYTLRTSRSFTNDPSFSTELNPVFRFFHSFYHLPWISDRSTVDYSPLAGFGGKSGGRGIIKKPGQSWYRKKGDADVGGITSNSLDLLAAASGEGDTGSVLSPLGGWRRRVARRNTVEHGGGGHQRHHHRRHPSTRQHGHGRGHGNTGHGHGHGVSGRRRYRRRSTSTITFEEYHHQRNPSPMIPSTYPFPFVSPPFPYFQAFPAVGGSGTPANADTSTAANQGTPAPAAGTGGETQNGTPTQGQAEPKSGGTPRGPRPWGSRAAIYPGGFAAYPPSPPMYPAPVWYPAGGGGEGGDGGGGRRQAGVVYMPVMPGGYV